MLGRLLLLFWKMIQVLQTFERLCAFIGFIVVLRQLFNFFYAVVDFFTPSFQNSVVVGGLFWILDSFFGENVWEALSFLR